LEGDYDAAMRHGRESERLSREIGDVSLVVWQLIDIGPLSNAGGREYSHADCGMRAAFELLSREFNPRFVSLLFRRLE